MSRRCEPSDFDRGPWPSAREGEPRQARRNVLRNLPKRIAHFYDVVEVNHLATSYLATPNHLASSSHLREKVDKRTPAELGLTGRGAATIVLFHVRLHVNDLKKRSTDGETRERKNIHRTDEQTGML